MIELALAIYLETVYLNSKTVSRAEVRDWYERQQEQARGRNEASLSKSIVQPGTPLTDQIAAAMCRGWNDFRTGYGVVKLYENANESTQRNYEMGRAFAATVKAIHELPPWPPQLTYTDMIARGMISPRAHEAIMREHDWQLRKETS